MNCSVIQPHLLHLSLSKHLRDALGHRWWAGWLWHSFSVTHHLLLLHKMLLKLLLAARYLRVTVLGLLLLVVNSRISWHWFTWLGTERSVLLSEVVVSWLLMLHLLRIRWQPWVIHTLMLIDRSVWVSSHATLLVSWGWDRDSGQWLLLLNLATFVH